MRFWDADKVSFELRIVGRNNCYTETLDNAKDLKAHFDRALDIVKEDGSKVIVAVREFSGSDFKDYVGFIVDYANTECSGRVLASGIERNNLAPLSLTYYYIEDVLNEWAFACDKQRQIEYNQRAEARLKEI